VGVARWQRPEVCFAAAALAYSLAALPAEAADATRFYQVDPGNLAAALRQFTQQTDRAVLFDAGLIAGRRTSGFVGVATAALALDRLLANSGLETRTSKGGALLIVSSARSAEDAVSAANPVATSRRPPTALASDAPSIGSLPLSEPSLVQQLVVTGSLVVRDGYRAPTPVTMVDVADLTRNVPSNIPDGLNQLPQFSGSRSQAQSALNATAITPAAGNYLNLRGLGFVRSLILFDGQRVPPTSYEGIVDTNILPQALVKRVDVVTAGASATYGSDALSGVVNFVLDKSFTGVKGSAQVSESGQGDDRSYRLTFAGGQQVLEGRGHLLFSAEHYQSDGIRRKEARPLYDAQPIAYGNGVSVPYRTEYGARTSITTSGGVILSGPLALQKFTPGGALSPFDQGVLPAIGGVQIGGDGGLALSGSLVGALRTDQLFGRAAYALADGIEAFVQAAFGESRNRYAHNGADNRLGNLTIFSGNAYLPASAQAVLDATGTDSFLVGRQGFEQGPKIVDVLNDSTSVFAGLQGRFAGDWTWRVNYAGGRSYMRVEHTRNPDNQRYFAAIDAVRDPQTSAIICRVSLTNPGLYPGCVPLNILGARRTSPEAIAYVFGQNSQYRVRNSLQDLTVTLTGTPFQAPAGPVSVAIGAERRTQTLLQTSNADPAVAVDTTGLRGFPRGQSHFGNTNQGIARGSQQVSEAYGEVVVPVLKGMRFAESLELNGAGRVTDYSTSGRVETWKIGVGYAPILGLKFRATASLDIRAPTLNELYSGAQVTAQAFNDIHTGRTVTITTISRGSMILEPEIGRAKTVGLIYRPAWLPGLSASVDYYDLSIRGAIAIATPDQINQDCESSDGAAPSCGLIFRPGGFADRSPANAVQRVEVSPRNISQIYANGVDFDARYHTELGAGALDLRLLANYTPNLRFRDSPSAAVRQRAGVGGDAFNASGGNPKWRALFSAVYARGPVTLNLEQRYVSRLVRSLTPGVYEDNVIDPVQYVNAGLSWTLPVEGRPVEAFVTIDNLFDRAPPLVPFTTEPGLRYPTLQGVYDVIGRQFTLGVRFRL
jgi:iron complex outermembrane receptor protein